MGKQERLPKEPKRTIVALDRSMTIPGSDVDLPLFTIVRIEGEKRKRMVIGNASDHVLDY